jgi:hypothetical protein
MADTVLGWLPHGSRATRTGGYNFAECAAQVTLSSTSFLGLASRVFFVVVFSTAAAAASALRASLHLH